MANNLKTPQSDYSQNIGKQHNPLEVIGISTYRKEQFQKYVTPNKGGENGYLFKDQNTHQFEHDYFALNLATNPRLNTTDFQIGMYLHKKLVLDHHFTNGFGFWTSNKNQSDYEFGEARNFYIYKEGSVYEIPKPFIVLIDDLKKHNIDLKHETVIKSLRKLHKNLFISMTTKHGFTKDPADPKTRSEYRYIEIYHQMLLKPIYKDWIA